MPFSYIFGLCQNSKGRVADVAKCIGPTTKPGKSETVGICDLLGTPYAPVSKIVPVKRIPKAGKIKKKNLESFN